MEKTFAFAMFGTAQALSLFILALIYRRLDSHSARLRDVELTCARNHKRG